MAGRPAKPDTASLKVGENQPGTANVDPRAVVMGRRRDYPWNVDQRGWLLFDNPEFICEKEKSEMLCDAQISALTHLRRSMVLQDGIQILPTEGVEPMIQAHVVNKKYDQAVQAAELCRWMCCNTRDSLHGTLMQIQEADWWCNLAAELIWRDQSGGDYNGKLMLDRMPVYGPWDYLIWRKNGEIIGLQSLSDVGTDPANPKIYPLEKFALNIFRPGRRHPFGIDLARVSLLPHFMKREAQPDWLRNLAQFGSPTAVATAPEDVTGQVPRLDANNEPIMKDGQPDMTSPQAAMADAVKNGVFSGGYVGLPAKAQLKFLEALNSGTAFGDIIKWANWELAVAILGTGTLTQEQNYGSNATAKTGEKTVSKPITSDKSLLADLIKKSICTPAVRYNLPPNYWDVIPTVTCGDPNADVFVELLKVLMNSPQTQVQLPELCEFLVKRLGLPGVDFMAIQDAVENGKPLPGTVPGTGGASGGGSTQSK